jgi:NDP-sugar pyrophosphorylase family protein
VNTCVAILAGGLATRLHPMTLEIPKSLIKVNEYPFIGWQLNLLAKKGVKSVVLCLGHKAKEIMDFVEKEEFFGLDIEYSVENQSLGTGGALKYAQDKLGDVFGVLYGDSYLPFDYKKVFLNFENSDNLGIMTIFRNENRFDRSNVMITSEGQFKYSKKVTNSEMMYIDYGFSILRKESLMEFRTKDRFDLSDLFENLSNLSKMEFFEVQERFYEVGSFRGIFELESYLRGVEV